MPISASVPNQAALSEALGLVTSGRLNEATVLIQQALGGAQPAPVQTPRATCRTATPRRPACRQDRTAAPSSPGVPRFDPSSLPGLDLGSLPGLDLSALPGLPGGGAAVTSRPYRLHVPAELPQGPRPLLVLLHGGTQDAASFADAAGFNALADEHGFVVLYPEQVAAANPMRYWNWFNRADQQRGSGEPAILAALVEEVASTHDIDRSKVFVAGFSAGAAMASVLGATYPDVFAGIGVHSGLAHGAATDMISAFAAMRQAPATAPVGAVPVIVIHGDADPTVHVSNAGGVLDQFAPAGASRRTLREHIGGRDVERTVVERDGRPVAERLVIRGAGHTWSGGRAGGSYADPTGPNAAAEMVRFFAL
ncbi:MAG: PHB depolymerase family esterase [Propionibacteriaceae bacterium]|nr:PHB depolymerase family esterase [Propionibacteriaceae bacterium]